MCLALAALSLSSVMAGSGDIDSLRTLRELRWRYEDVSFGTHMALSMAIGE
jgi:anaphase-promoting complex subunit 1